jgi:hypothetical protein
MREIRQSGSVRGVRRNPYPYRDRHLLLQGLPIALRGRRDHAFTHRLSSRQGRSFSRKYNAAKTPCH